MNKKFISIITPAFNEEKNLPVFYGHLSAALSATDIEWEWIVVDDHSRDKTFETIVGLAEKEPRIKGFRLSRNSGSHRAIVCGLSFCRGDAAVVMAADMQDPPEEIPRLVGKWRDGAQVVWAVRRKREGEKAVNMIFSRFYYWLMRHLVRLQEMPAAGADFFLADRIAVNGILQFPEVNTRVLALLIWMGFRQTSIEYDKQARLYGASGWTLRKKLKLVIDSITCFSFFPIRVLSVVGMVFSCLGMAYAVLIFFNAMRGIPIQGWASLMIVILVMGGFQMLMLGVLGEYLWRNLEESRKRPRYLIENQIGCSEPQQEKDRKGFPHA